MTHIITSQKQAVFEIEISRLEAKNALSVDMYESLVEAINYFVNNSDLNVAIIRGSNQCFCAGNDLKDFLASAELNAEHPTVQFINAIAHCPKPIVAAVAGPAIGIGTTMLMHCDLVYAAQDTKFQLPFAHLGLCPEAGSSLLLSQTVGHVKAFEYLVLGRSFNAEDAFRLNIINQIIPAERLFTEVTQIAQQLSQLPTGAVMQAKRLMTERRRAPLDAAIAEELSVFGELLTSEDCQQRVAAFFNK